MDIKENTRLQPSSKFARQLLKCIFILCCSIFLYAASFAQCTASIDNVGQYCISGNSSVTFNNAVASGGTINWVTSGDGLFNNNTLQRPTYTPGSRDIANGYAFIYLDVYVDDPVNFCSVLPYVALYFNSINSVATPASQTTCSGAAITPIVMSGPLSTVTYTWTRNNTTTATGIAASGTGTIRGALTNTTTAPVTVTFTITPTTPTCTGTPITATVTVNPRVVATISPTSQTVCSGLPMTTINPSSNIPGSTFSWTRDNSASVSGVPGNGTGAIAGTLTNNTIASVPVTFTVTPSANGCSGTAVSSVVNVTPAPVVTATPASQIICSNAGINPIVLGSNTAGTTYNWTRDNTINVTGIAASGTTDISGSLTNNTTSTATVNFTVRGTAGGCTSAPALAAVVVNPVLNATATPATQSICSGAAIAQIALSSNIGSATYTWTRNNTASVTGIAASGTGNISGTLVNTSGSAVTVTFTILPTADGCSGTPIIATVVVNPAPAASATPASQTICSGAAINNIVLTSTPAGASYSWTRNNTATIIDMPASGTGDITGTLTNTTAVPATVNFSIVPSFAGCLGAAINAAVTVDPRPTSTITGSQSVCTGQPSAPISINFTGAGPWNFTYTDGTTPVTVNGNTANPFNFIVNPASPLTYTVTALSNSTCTALPAGMSGSAVLTQASFGITATAGANGTISPAGVTTVSCGGSQTYAITPMAGFEIQDVQVNGISQGAISSFTFNNVAAAQTINATFRSIASFIITATADANGTISPSGNVSVAAGGSQGFTFTPNSCFQIADVLVNGVSQGPISSFTFTNVSGPRTISVNFSQITYAITASAGQHGSITPAGITNVPCGGSQTYNITPGNNASIVDVLVNGVSQGPVSSYTFTNVTAPQTISATFAIGGNVITASAGANGTITPPGSITVPNNGSQTFAITAAPCFQIADVLVNGVSQGPVSSFTFNNVTAPQSISASFSAFTYNITASADANGSISPAGITTVACGGSQTYTFTPNNGFSIQNVFVNGVPQGAISSFTFANVTASQTINVVFAAASFVIDASAGANGSISPAGKVAASAGSNVTFNITPASCFRILDVLVNGVSQGAVNTFTFTSITADGVITAAFAPLNYNINASAAANGSISPSGAAAVNCGGSAVYSIIPNAGFTIQDVLVNGVSQGAISSYTFSNVTSDQSISASFVASTTTIAATAGANGTISPAGTVTLPVGGNQTFTIVPAACYRVADVQVNGISQGPISSYTFTGVTTPQTINATFSQLSFGISASAGANGSISPSGTTAVLCGGSQTYTITPASGFVIQSVLVNGVSQGAINSFTFSNVTANQTISAVFAASGPCVPPTLTATISNVACRNGNSGAIVLNPSGGSAPFTYAWSSANGFTSTQKDVSGLTAGTYTVRVTANGGCSVTANYTVTQPAAVLTATTTQGTITCNGGTTTVTVNATGGTLPYTGTGAVTNQAAGIRTYTVTDANGCVATRTVTLTEPTLITASISAGTIACSGGTTNLVVTSAGGTGARQFSLNGGAFQTSSTFIVNAAGSPYTVTVRDANLCTVNSNTIVVSDPAISTVPATPTAVDGQVYNLCGGGVFTYTVQAVANASSYTWAAPTGGTIVSGQGTNQVQISIPSTFTGSGGVGVSARNGCGSSTQFRFTVFAVLYYAPVAVNGPTTVVAGQTGVQYSVPATPNTSYNWTVPAGASITAGQGTNVVTVRFGSNGGNIGLDVTNACGTAPRTLKAVTIGTSRPAARVASSSGATLNNTIAGMDAPASAAGEAILDIYPNPATNAATVQFESKVAGQRYELTISSFTDRTMLSKTGVSNKGTNRVPIDLGKLKPGMYLVRYVSGNTIKTQKFYRL